MKILICGVGNGIGGYITEYFSKSNYVFISSRGAFARELADRLKIGYMQCDLRSLKDVRTLVSRASSAMDGLDVAINVAGNYFSSKAPWDYNPEEFADALLNNALTFYNVAIESSRCMAKNRDGLIIGFSAAGNVYLNSNPGYAAGKGSVSYMIKYFARSLLPYNVRVNGIAPGFIEKGVKSNERNLLYHGRFPANDIALAIENLMKSKMITGQIINISGGHDINIEPGL
ncbi:SDR family NAD(P)-dependent oxidoreductase [Picrophilus oshimae]|uniref:3-oxoacyl-[acyl-carrier-protein] reductase n=1 Tax=Picrophilus torridus (strain ATCC 700027 / DSM 9790 / JCM 10055 / NBRC 100828 / KAW 2/3) TaxID=1122961 RepID=A0A8G2L759_PICTO|nr:SDR family oxidoreductase [Picrophilus oshimae]SMD30747.1 3-oxoacyl-[acyl-carrier-protein] reductase [Picrophilus oshimae DSM 9789]